MVSRRKILSRSRDDLNLDDPPPVQADEEDIWYQKEKLYKDHIHEVLGKWESIDDEIWAKVIVLERNRRVAKAYARAPVLTINGSEDGFDGFRIGVNGFDNPMRDHKVTEFKDQIGLGCKVKMDEMGNILIKRFSKSPIYIKNTIEENSVSNDILKLPNGLLEFEKPFKLFDMKKFQQNVNREMKRQVPDRRKLECQCISTVAFVKNESELLDSPIWVMLINVVALEMLKAKLPTASGSPSRGAQVRSSSGRPPFPQSGSSDEDPYSLTPSGSSGSSGKGQNRFEERLPNNYGPQNWAKTQRPDFSDDMDEENTLSKKHRLKTRKATEEKRKSNKTASQQQAESSGDDPYYCGLRARVPNFVQSKQQQQQTKSPPKSNGHIPSKNVPPVRSAPNLAQLPGAHPFWWHSRLYPESAATFSPPDPSLHPGVGLYPTMPYMTQELSSYHAGAPRGMGRNAPAYRSSQFSAPPIAHANRPAVFRTGWE